MFGFVYICGLCIFQVGLSKGNLCLNCILNKTASSPIKTNISKIGKVRNELFSLPPQIVSVNTPMASLRQTYSSRWVRVPRNRKRRPVEPHPAIVLESTNSSVLEGLIFGDYFSDVFKFVICSYVQDILRIKLHFITFNQISLRRKLLWSI